MTANVIQELIGILTQRNLTAEESQRAFQIIMNGGATPAQIAAFLMGLRVRGETVDDITSGAEALRVKAPRVNAPAGTIDVCGTGGDSRGTYNISTAVAMVVAACGVPVAKHGNRGVSSKSGSADVLEFMGVKLDAPLEKIEQSLTEGGLCFMMAPQFHPAMRHVAPVRQELGFRTIFNLLGPLANPAQPKLQLLGVFSKDWLEPMARVLIKLGVERAWVVHGSDGLDELTTTGTSHVAELKDGRITQFTVSPEDAGLEHATIFQLKGRDIETNAMAMQDMLLGATGPYRDVVLLNAAAALIIAGKAENLAQGVEIAAAAVDEGKANRVLKKLVEITNG